MTEAPRLSPQPEYIVDHYSVLGISSKATPSDIKEAFRTKIPQYHPDKYVSLAPEMQQRAAFQTRVLNEAFEILSNAESKTAFDLQLSQWTGPISKDGVPIVDISRAGSYSDDELNKIMEWSILQSGFDENTFSFIEKQYRSDKNPSSELKKAYESMLEKKNIALTLQESFRRESLGLDGDEATRNSPPIDYLLQAQNDIAKGRLAVAAQIDETVIKLTEGKALLLAPGGQELEITDEALAKYREKALEKYNLGAQELEKLAEEKQKVIEERLKLVKGEYLSQDTASPQLVIVMETSQNHFNWYGFQLKGEENIEFFLINPDDKLDTLKAKGYSIIKVDHAEGLPIKEELNRAVIRHFEDRDEKTERKTED